MKTHLSLLKSIVGFFLLISLVGCSSEPSIDSPVSQESEVSQTPVAVSTTIRLEQIQGDITLMNEDEKELSPLAGMQLLDGNTIATWEESFAFLSLAHLRAAKLDQVSKVNIKQSGQELELNLQEGNLFFNIENSLTQDETLNIRTSTMDVGIRGTSGVVRAGTDDLPPGVYVLDGEITLTLGSETLEVSAGSIAEIVSGEIHLRTLEENEIDPFVIDEIRNSETLQDRLEENLDIESILYVPSEEPWREGYKAILEENLESIQSYKWYGLSQKSIAITNICGDDAPELLFIGSEEWKAQLSIYNAQSQPILIIDSFDLLAGSGTQYSIFTTDSGEFYIYTRKGSENANIHTSLEQYELRDLTLVNTHTISSTEDNRSSSYQIDGVDCTPSEYEDASNAIFSRIQFKLIKNYDEDVPEALSEDDAFAFLAGE